MRWTCDRALIVCAALTVSTSAMADTVDRWVTFRHDYQRTGRTSIVGPSALNTVKWRVPVGPPPGSTGVVQSSPAIGLGGEVYITAVQVSGGAANTYIASFRPDGTLRWRYLIGSGQTDSSPSLADDDTLYVGSGGAGVEALLPDGNVIWNSVGLQLVLASPTLFRRTLPDQSSRLCVGVGTHGVAGAFLALDAIDRGIQTWVSGDSPGSVDSSAAIGPDGTLYFGSQGNGGRLNAVRSVDGSTRWTALNTVGSVEGAPVVGPDGTVYCATLLGFIYAVNGASGQVKWQWPADSTQIGPSYYSSPALASDGTIYVGGTDGVMYAIQPTGQLKWQFDTGLADPGVPAGEIISSPAIGGDGTIYFGCGNGVVYAITASGILKSRFITDSRTALVSSPAIGPDGTLYIGSDDGTLYAFRARPPVPGDLNGDGKITVVDAQIALNLVVDPSKLTKELLAIGDVYPPRRPDGTYGDGKLTIADVIRILQRAVGVISEIP